MGLFGLTAVLMLGLVAQVSVCAQNKDVIAEKCHQMALKAHPLTLPNKQAAANLRDQYYNLCVARLGKLGPASATTGQKQ
jgi:hypothetical protein